MSFQTGSVPFGASHFSFKAAQDFSSINDATRAHLRNVYVTLMVSMVAAAVGAAVNIYTAFFFGLSPFLATLASMGCMFGVTFTAPHKFAQRFALTLGVAFFMGVSIAPLLAAVAYIDPAIIVSAFVGTSAIFASFSAAALVAKRRSFLYLGGFLGSALSCLMWMSLFSLFFGSSAFLFDVRLYLGLLVMSAFVIFDTQMIVERFNMGDKDFLQHSITLFIDFVGIFVRLLIILSKNKSNDRNNNKNRRR